MNFPTTHLNHKIMEAIAFVMTLKKGNEAEYERRHDEIWTELSDALREAGIVDYQIFLEPESGTLFAYQLRHTDHKVDALASLPIVQRWWHFMSNIMEVNADESPVVKPLKRVFEFKG
jgi:L-rhamnose mutarotase